ncbi:MAG: hypothetical protein HFE73_06810 [Firmicutes bacterium]|nr:hypothetical protein [Bacillota bacterium]
MKTTITKRKWEAIYRLLNRVSPVDYDCGTLCGAACCMCPDTSTDGDGTDYEMGIYLYPGEEKIHDRKEETWLKWSVERAEDYEFPDSWYGNIYFVRCKTPPHCPRNKRPLQCRIYPLAPHITEDGVLTLIRNQEDLPYECPLIAKHMELNPSFVKATYTVWVHLLRDPLIFDLVEMDSKLRMIDGSLLEFEEVSISLP